MSLKGTTVTADKRKGLVYIYQSEDSLMHFCWKDRNTSKVEDDLIIFPDDIEYKRVKQCTTGRAFILKFKSSSRKFFFWMQEPKTDKDEENCSKVNSLLNNPPTPGSGGNSAGGTGMPSGLASALEEHIGDSQLQGLLGNMDQQQLLQLWSGLGGMSGLTGASATPPAASPTPSRVQSSPGPRNTASTTPSETPTPRPATAAPSVPPQTPPPRQAVQLSDLQNILSNIQVPVENEQSSSVQRGEVIDLSRVLTPEALGPLLSNPEFRERLTPFLPSGGELPQLPSDVSSNLWSPQFQQAVGMFSSALQSGQLGPLMSQFGFDQEVVDAAAKGDMVEFVNALQSSSRPGTASSTSTTRPPTSGEEKPPGKVDKKDDEDEHMSLD